MITSIDKIHRRVLGSVSRTDVINIWKSLHKSKNDSCGVRLTSMLPLELNEFILGYGEYFYVIFRVVSTDYVHD